MSRTDERYLNAEAPTRSFWRELFVGLQRWVWIFFVDTIIPVLAVITSVEQTQILHDYACRNEKITRNPGKYS